jgi:hypothetical protein
VDTNATDEEIDESSLCQRAVIGAAAVK